MVVGEWRKVGLWSSSSARGSTGATRPPARSDYRKSLQTALTAKAKDLPPNRYDLITYGKLCHMYQQKG